MRFLFAFIGPLVALLTQPLLAQPKTPVKTHSTLFTIRAVDERTAADVPAQFRVRAQMARQTFAGRSGDRRPFTFVLTRTDTLDVITSAPDYAESEEIMAVSCDTCADYEYVVKLARPKKQYVAQTPKPQSHADSVFRDLAVNTAIRLDNVYFDQSSYVLRPESYPQLDKLARTLRSTPGLSIEIAGHTDNVGDRRLNQLLSENRAKIITSYLVRSGIAEERLRHTGYGDARPAAPNDSEVNKRQNRRVEFVVLAM